eukprot:Skav204999  [mRNA]  locus=scaffold3521:46731:48782:- [translate_table: standard]
MNVSLAERDLGGHMNFSRKNTIYTIKRRIKDNFELWTWLARSQATEEQKTKVLASVAWPRCLHGITGTSIGVDHYVKLRSAAMAALGWAKKGANPIVQLGMRDKPQAGPLFWAIRQSVMMFRKQSRRPEVVAIVDQVADANPYRYHQGPAGALLQRFHLLGWAWMGQGYVRDHEQLTWHIEHIPIQALMQRLEHAWYQYVAGQVHEREGFGGITMVDVPATFRHHNKKPADHKGLMRVSLNGTFFTNDKLVHTGKVVSNRCCWCDAPDDVEHRTWHCPGFQRVRSHALESLPEADRAIPCTIQRGWILEQPAHLAFRRALCEQPNQVHVHDMYWPPTHHDIHMFTDGSTVNPTSKTSRLSSWAVVFADLEQDAFLPCSMGGCPGLVQTTPRAELTAAVSAFSLGLKCKRAFYLWTDSQQVHDRISAFAQGATISHMIPDHDLWTELWELWSQTTKAGYFQQVVKVRSHQDPIHYSELVDQWVIRGNDAADYWAGQAKFSLLTKVRIAHEAAVTATDHQEQIRTKVHSVICAVGTQAVESKPDTRVRTGDDWDEVDRNVTAGEQPSFHPFPMELTDVSGGSLGPHVTLLHRWMKMLITAEGAQLRWLTSYELLAHYQATTKHVGYWYDTATKTFQDATEWFRLNEFDFNKAAGWFQAALKELAKQLGTQFHPVSRLPHSSIFHC